MHEELSRAGDIKGPSNKSFGVTFSAFLLAAGIAPVFHKKNASISYITLAAVLLGLALFVPNMLAPLNRAWFKLGLLLSKIANPIVLGVLYFGIFTPTAIIRKMLKVDALRLRWEPDAQTYWIPGPSANEIASMTKQY